MVIYTNFTNPSLKLLGAVTAWTLNFIWIAPAILYFSTFSLFPNGQLPGPQWRWVLGLLVIFALGAGGAVLIESPMHSAFSLPNPFWVDFPGRQTLYNLLFGLGVAALALAALGLVVLVLHRLRQATPTERQQFKWLGLSGLAGALCLIVGLTLGIGFKSVVGQWLVDYAVAIPPIGVGIAVLRYRLYDIDLVIRRTLAYTLLTMLLALIYFSSVVILQYLFTVLTGQQSAVAVVLSTLAIAGLFFPLRNRIQTFIDQRFFRRKYDAAQALADFAAVARAETDLDTLAAKLAAVVGDTMQPEGLGIWVKDLQSQPTSGPKIPNQNDR
jgi:hypothetical protein